MKKTSSAVLIFALLAGLVYILLPTSTDRDPELDLVLKEPFQVGLARTLPSSVFKNDSGTETVSDANQLSPESSSFRGAEELPESEQASLWKAFSESRRAIRPLTDNQRTMPENEGADYLASNPSQKIRARFLQDGVRLLSSYPNRDWSGVIGLDTDAVAEIRHEGAKLEYVRPGIVEWYHNKPDGLEHGFIVEQRLSDSTSEALVVPVFVDGLTVAPLDGRSADSSDLQFVNSEGEPVLSYTGLKVWDANGLDLDAKMAPIAGGLQVLVADADAAYPITIDPIIANLSQQLSPHVTGDGISADAFGVRLDLDDGRAIIGSPGLGGAFGIESFRGEAYIFRKDLDGWVEKARLLDPLADSYGFGFAVALSSDTAMVSAWDEGNEGHVNVYRLTEGQWSYVESLNAVDRSAEAYFGVSISLEGDEAFIGSVESDWQGGVYHFTEYNDSWVQSEKITASDGVSGDRFGGATAICDNYLLVGATNAFGNVEGSGCAYIFSYQNGAWFEQAKLVPTSGDAYQKFGISLSISKDYALVGGHQGSYLYQLADNAWNEVHQFEPCFSLALEGTRVALARLSPTTLMGELSIFEFDSGSWMLDQRISVPRANSSEVFGWSIDMNEGDILVGTLIDGYEKTYDSTVYAFEYIEDSWEQTEQIDAGREGNSATLARFGHAVDIQGDLAVIGAPYATENGIDSGIVYVFERTSDVWKESAKITPDDAGPSRRFGQSIALGSSGMIVGQRNNAYIFELVEEEWTQRAKLSSPQSGYYGENVSISGSLAVVGDGFWDCAYVYEQQEVQWILSNKIEPLIPKNSRSFGSAVVTNGNDVLVGEPNYREGFNSVGAVYCFSKENAVWEQQQVIVPYNSTDTEVGDFGSSLSMFGDTFVSGAPDDRSYGSYAGAAYIYKKSGGVWEQIHKMYAEEPTSRAYFGWSVSMSEDFVGIALEGTARGMVQVFLRVGDNLEVSKLVDFPLGDRNQRALSIDGNTLLLGASDYTGINSEGEAAPQQGAVYVYRLFALISDTDGDDASDTWETANGFNAAVAGDFLTLDSDLDGALDLLEIFQGTDKSSAADRYGLLAEPADADAQTMTARFRRATGNTGVIATYEWSCNLTDWYVVGMDDGSIKVEFSESVVSSGAGYEIVELTATITLGSADHLFIRIKVEPFE